MGCPLLLDKAWGWSESLTAREILVKNSNNQGTIRGEPEQWTAQVWRDTYGFRAGDVSTPEVREFVYDYIKTAEDPREGWSMDGI